MDSLHVSLTIPTRNAPFGLGLVGLEMGAFAQIPEKLREVPQGRCAAVRRGRVDRLHRGGGGGVERANLKAHHT